MCTEKVRRDKTENHILDLLYEPKTEHKLQKQTQKGSVYTYILFSVSSSPPTCFKLTATDNCYCLAYKNITQHLDNTLNDWDINIIAAGHRKNRTASHCTIWWKFAPNTLYHL